MSSKIATFAEKIVSFSYWPEWKKSILKYQMPLATFQSYFWEKVGFFALGHSFYIESHFPACSTSFYYLMTEVHFCELFHSPPRIEWSLTRGRIHGIVARIAEKSIGKPRGPGWAGGRGHSNLVFGSLVNMFHAHIWGWKQKNFFTLEYLITVHMYD